MACCLSVCRVTRWCSVSVPSPPQEALQAHIAWATVQQQLELVEAKNRKPITRFLIHAPLKHGPAPALDSLTPIALWEVAQKANHVHEGRVLFVRTVGYSGIRTVGLCLLVEDEAGDRAPLVLVNQVQTQVCAPPPPPPPPPLPCGALLAPPPRSASFSQGPGTGGGGGGGFGRRSDCCRKFPREISFSTGARMWALLAVRGIVWT